MKVEESLNVTFDESSPPTKLSPLVDDDVGEEEAIERKVKVDNNNVENESIEVDEVVNIKESRPLEQVIGNPNQRTLRSQAQNKSNFFCCISTIEPWNVNEALGDESWVVAMQEELNQFIANDYIKVMFKKFGLEDSKPTKTPMSTEIKLTKDDEAESVDSTNIESLDALENNLEPNPPYYSNLPLLDDIRSLIHRRLIFENETKEGIVHKLPNQIEINKLLDHLKPCELVIRENAYVAIGNRDYVQAYIALVLYCLEVDRPFSLAYFVIRRMYYFRERIHKVLPYGIILTRFFKNYRATMEDHPFDDCYTLVSRLMPSLKAKKPRRPPPKQPRNVGKSKQAQLPSSSSCESAPSENEDLPSIKLSPRSYNRAFLTRKNMSIEQRETRGMFKNMAQALHSMGRMLKKECR
ncbi:hypothetical protein Tco_0856967 [Tanacetum coccineum]|uniref:Uncharacterized protein n=1 Tax=Tanacetum coccineum TaxID=301880 RepID=A0ABQ5B5A8_9ASTR